MAVPKSRTSKARRKQRRAKNYRLEMPALSVCPKCGETKLPHRVCLKCGTYKDVEVITISD